MRGPAFFAYSDNYLIDVKFGIIMDVEASRAIRQAEVGAAKSTIERTEQRFDIKPERLAGGTAYGSGANLNWLINEAKIVPHIPVVDEASGMRRKGRVTPLTRERYHELLASYVLPALGDRAIQKLTPTQIDQVYIALEERLSPATVRHVHIALKACLATAVRKGFLVNNPAAKADAPRKVDPEVGRALSAEEVTRLLAGLANTPYYPIVATAVMTGMRLGELLTLRWDDIDFAAHTIRIARALEHTKQFGARIKQPKSWHGKRTIGIDPALTSILKAQHSRHLRLRAGVSERAVVSLGAIRLPAEALVFPATTVRDGRFDFSRIRNARALTKETRTRFRKLGFAGLRFHDLRVTHATALLDAGVPVHTVAQRIGNRPDVLLRAYAKSTSSADERTNGVLATLARSLG
jgi:integrase